MTKPEGNVMNRSTKDKDLLKEIIVSKCSVIFNAMDGMLLLWLPASSIIRKLFKTDQDWTQGPLIKMPFSIFKINYDTLIPYFIDTFF